MKKIVAIFLIAISGLLIGTNSYGVTRTSMINFRPQPDEGPFFSIRQSQNLEQYQLHFSSLFDFAYRPLKARLGVLQQFNIVKNLYTQHFLGSFGLTDWLEISMSIPLVWHTRQINPDTLGAATGHTDIGDFQVEIKGRILDNSVYPVGLSIAPIITAPTGNENFFLGEDGITAGGRLILDTVIADRLTLAFNFGGIVRKKLNMYGIFLDDQLLFGGGAAVKIVENLSAALEIDVSTPFEKPFQSKNSTPIDFRGGLKWDVAGSGLVLGVGGGSGINFGSGSPQFRALALVSYTTHYKEEPKTPTIDYDGIESQISKTFYFASGSAALTAAGVQDLGEVAVLMSENSWIKLISINSYADDIGTRAFNMALSNERAKTVYNFLNDHGTAPRRMIINNHGPISGDLKTSRRVEIGIVDTLRQPNSNN